LARLVGEKGQYQILLFALENPHQCAHTITVSIHPSQRMLLKEWVITGQNWTSVGAPGMSKSVLSAELEKLKPKIVAELEKDSTDGSMS
jgi:serine/threonine-protein kinase